MSNLIYPGSFDIFTNGHADIIERGLKLPFDNLIVAILINSNKKNPLFDFQKREEIIKEIYKDTPKIKVISSCEALVRVATEYDCTHILRGIRGITDLASEMELAHANLDVSLKRIETIFLMTSLENTYISSSRVREQWRLGFNINTLVPPLVNEELKKLRLLEMFKG